jgi:hypothetical protein
LPILVLVLAVASIAQGQSESAEQPDYQQLQKRIDQLEQELRELKQTVSAARTSTPPSAVVAQVFQKVGSEPTGRAFNGHPNAKSQEMHRV